MDPHANEPGNKAPQRGPLAIATGASVELLVWVGIAVYIGRKADARLGTDPWLLLVSTLLGISLGLYRFIRETSIRPNGSP